MIISHFRASMKNLEGVIFDFACNLHRYALNREPMDFVNIHFLVDGSHWPWQKKKETDKRSGKKGHLGCSSGYNFNDCKEYIKVDIDGAKNTQGRKQMHCILHKLGKSLRQKNYFNFMRYIMAFLPIRNLLIMDKI